MTVVALKIDDQISGNNKYNKVMTPNLSIINDCNESNVTNNSNEIIDSQQIEYEEYKNFAMEEEIETKMEMASFRHIKNESQLQNKQIQSKLSNFCLFVCLAVVLCKNCNVSRSTSKSIFVELAKLPPLTDLFGGSNDDDFYCNEYKYLFYEKLADKQYGFNNIALNKKISQVYHRAIFINSNENN